MSILFIHPPLDAFTSGGNVFNRHIIEHAQQSQYPLNSIPVSVEQLPQQIKTILSHNTPGVIVWDSLFMDELGKGHLLESPTHHALLLHYLPSLNPRLTDRHRYMLQNQETKAINSVDSLIVTGRRVKNVLSRIYPSTPIILSQPGVDNIFLLSERTAQPSRQTKNLLTVGCLTADKGYIHLLEILSQLRQHPWIWHISGDQNRDPAFFKEFNAKIRKLNLDQRIIFHQTSSSKRLAELLKTIDVFMSASYYESFGMALAEAVAAHIPAIATETGHCQKLIKHQTSGYRVPVGEWGLYKQLLKKMITDSVMLNQFRCQAPVEKPLTWQACFDAFISVDNSPKPPIKPH